MIIKLYINNKMNKYGGSLIHAKDYTRGLSSLPKNVLVHDIRKKDPMICIMKNRLFNIFQGLRYKIVSDVILQILELLILVDEFPFILMQNEIISKNVIKDIKFIWLTPTDVYFHPHDYKKYSICIQGKNIEFIKKRIMQDSDSGESNIRYVIQSSPLCYINIYIIIPIITLKMLL